MEGFSMGGDYFCATGTLLISLAFAATIRVFDTQNVQASGFVVCEVAPPPFTALTADRLGSLSKTLFERLGVPKEWGAHASRGAGVSFYKSLGLDTEQVAQLGK